MQKRYVTTNTMLQLDAQYECLRPFLNKIHESTKYKNLKIDINSLINLIFSGACDNLFDIPPQLDDYLFLIEKIKQIKKSKAEFKEANINEQIGTKDVKDILSLNIYRTQINPLNTFSYYSFFKIKIANCGFVPTGKTHCIYKSNNNFIFKSINYVLNNETLLNYYLYNYENNICAVVKIEEACEFMYGADKKKALKIKFNTGEEKHSTVLWKDIKTNKYDPVLKNKFKKGNIGIIFFKLTETKERVNLKLIDFIVLNDS